MRKILFIGATGMLGKPVAKELIKSGFDLTLLARDINKAKTIFPDGKLIQGDVFDKKGLVKAMTGIDAIYCSLSIEQTSKEKDKQPEREGIDNIIDAAKEAAINRIAYLSSLVHLYEGMNNFSWWVFRTKHLAVQKIKSSGIAYSIFYPSTFMETFPYQIMRGNKIAMVGYSEAPMWFIAASDYARQVASSFKMVTNENKEYIIQGLEPFTFDDANKIVVNNYPNAKLKVMKVPISLMKFLGNFNQRFNYAWHICEALNKYPEKFEGEQSWKELGKPVITLKDFIAGL